MVDSTINLVLTLQKFYVVIESMTEDFLKYIWLHRLFLPETSYTTEKEQVEILVTGQHNTDSGPDFINARVRIGDTFWAGCVEIHIQASDWERHGHNADPAYNSVILHVVYNQDADAFNANRQKIPAMELHFDSRYYETYNRLVDSKERIACQDDIGKIDEFSLIAWLERLTIERLEQKAEAIMRDYAATDNDWEETLYRQLARNFGFSLNALPFELLAKSLPLKILLKHKDNLLQLEALLFGQAGMLADEKITDTYFVDLRKEYLFLQKKYSLQPVDRYFWKFLRLRPINFPSLRISQFACLIFQNANLFSQIIETESVDSLEKLFDLKASAYWDDHYVFGKESPKRNKSLGKSATQTIFINTVAPFLFVYGKARGNDIFCSRALSILENLPAEKNTIVKKWEELKVRNSNAFTSQSLLQLNNTYCQPKRCLHCAIGNRIVRSCI